MQADQRNCAALPSHDIEVYIGRLNITAIPTRPSYLNAVLIQSRGTVAQCFHCRRNPTRGPFPECRATDFFGGCCANCKYRDHGARCEIEEVGDSTDDTYEDDEYSTDDESEESDASRDWVSPGVTDDEEKSDDGQNDDEENGEEDDE